MKGTRTLEQLRPEVVRRGLAASDFLGRPGVLGAVLTILRLEGRVARTSLSPPLDRGTAVFVTTDRLFPDEDVANLPHEEALRRICAWYFRVHGPATQADFGWWTGADPALVAEVFAEHSQKLVEVRIDDLPFRYYLPRTTLDALLEYGRPAIDEVTLVPHRDPWLSSHEGRTGRFFRSEDLPKFGQGPPLPAILVSGKVAGRWEVVMRTGEVRLTWFRKTTSSVIAAAERRAEEISRFILREMPDIRPLSVPTPEGPVPVYL